jgi:hypothetical protein
MIGRENRRQFSCQMNHVEIVEIHYKFFQNVKNVESLNRKYASNATIKQ